MSAPNKVHLVVPGFQAITEFAGHNDDCGPCANQVCAAAVEGRAPTTDGMNAIRARDLAAGVLRPGQGQRIDEVAWDVATWTHPQIATALTPLGHPVEGPDGIHQRLHDAMMRGNPCVLNLALAGQLPHNEAGIHYHFVAVGGIDADLGYLIANGDEVPFGHVGAYWVKWPSIAAAQPCALLEYHMPAPPPAPPSDPTTELHAQIATLTSERDAYLAKITSAQHALA